MIVSTDLSVIAGTLKLADIGTVPEKDTLPDNG
jgi:hypothetical protein